jgi:hypothetical protein
MMAKPMVYCWFTIGITPSDAFLSCLQIVGLQIAYYIPAAGRMPEWQEFGWQMRQKGRFWMLRMEEETPTSISLSEFLERIWRFGLCANGLVCATEGP